MKPTIVEDSESDEDAIKDAEDNVQNEQVLKSLKQEDDDPHEDNEHEDDEDEEDDDDDVAAPPPEGIYEPGDFEDLEVGQDIKDLFNDILRYIFDKCQD